MRRYILYIDGRYSEEFETLFLNKSYVKNYSKTEDTNDDLIYILTIGNTFKEVANFYVDVRNAKESGIVYFVGFEILEED